LKSPSEIRVEVGADAATTALLYAADTGGQACGATLILGHGAGAGQQSAFIVSFARALAGLGTDAVTFNFLYTEQRRRLPDRARLLETCYCAVVEAVRERVESARAALFIGGKSMGGRIATQVAAADPGAPIAGLVLLGYPLHPPGKPERRRDAHLPAVKRPMLFVQGSRDPFGKPEELEPLLASLVPRPTLHVVEGGDHSFKPPRNAQTQAALDDDVRWTVAAWIAATRGGRGTRPWRG
jgi:predicted alpha/beta-hydrolase family hydrolase